MSSWQDYGFPDPAGVERQKALEGLLLAAAERVRICQKNNNACEYRLEYFYADKPRLIGQVFYDIDAILGELSNLLSTDSGSYVRFLLPDGQNFSLENAAAYLGEELISLPGGSFSNRDWRDPYPALGYDWITQRYRFLNLLYLLQLPDASVYGREKIIYGWGESIPEAWENTETEERSIRGWSYLQADITTFRMGLDVTDYYFKKYIFLPEKIIYPFYVPSQLTYTATAAKPNHSHEKGNCDANSPECVFFPSKDDTIRYSFDALGTPLRFREKTLLFDIELGKTTEKDKEISLSGLYADAAASAFANTPVKPPLDKTLRSEHIRGFRAQGEMLCDFRNYLNFYDPLLNTGEK